MAIDDATTHRNPDAATHRNPDDDVGIIGKNRMFRGVLRWMDDEKS